MFFCLRMLSSSSARTVQWKRGQRRKQGPLLKGPLTLLVDKGTASAAEVFAAAVRYEVAIARRRPGGPLKSVLTAPCSVIYQ